MRNIIFFLVGFMLTFFCGLALAVVPPASLSYVTAATGSVVPWTMDLTGNGDHYYNSARGDGWQRVTPANTYDKAVPYDIKNKSGQLIRVPVPAKIPVDVPRIGAAVTKFMKRVGPLATGIAIVDLACDLSQICPSEDNTSWMQGTIGTYANSQSCKDAAGDPAGVNSGCNTYVVEHPTYIWWRSGQNYTIPNGCLLQTVKSWSYSAGGYDCSGAEPPDSAYSPATESNWYAAETILSAAAFIEHLDAAKEPIPASLPTLTPVSTTGESSDVVTRDANGNPTGTTRTQTQYDLAPAPTASDPFNMQITETITTTIINSSGDTVSSSVTTYNPDPVAEKETTVKFDTPTAIDVPKSDIPIEFTAQNWGSSAACPSDPVLNLPGGFTITLPVHVVCDAMDMLKPVVLLIASLAAGLIIMGAVKS